MSLLETLGLKKEPVGPPAVVPGGTVDADAVRDARGAVEAEIDREPPKLSQQLVRQFVESRAPDLGAWLPAGSGFTGVRNRKLPSGGSQRLIVQFTPGPSQTTAGMPAADGSLEVSVNVHSQFRVDADRIARALVTGKLAADRKTIRALLAREATRGVAAQLLHELTHAAIRFENALPRSQQTMMSTKPESIIEKLRQHQSSLGMMRDQKLIFDVQKKLAALLRAADIVPTKEALRAHEQRLIEEKFAADQGEGAADVPFTNLKLAEGTLRTIVQTNPDLAERDRKIVIDKLAPALARLYDEMDSIRSR